MSTQAKRMPNYSVYQKLYILSRARNSKSNIHDLSLKSYFTYLQYIPLPQFKFMSINPKANEKMSFDTSTRSSG